MQISEEIMRALNGAMRRVDPPASLLVRVSVDCCRRPYIVFMLVLCLCISLLMGTLPFWRQYRAVATIKAVGAHIERRSVVPRWIRDAAGECLSMASDTCVAVRFPVGASDPSGFVALQHLRGVSVVSLQHATLDAAGLESIGALRTVELVDMRYARFPEEALPALWKNSQLWQVLLAGTPASDASLRGISRLANIRVLDLAGTQVSDVSLDEIACLRDLRWLDISGTMVSNVGLSKLQRVVRLRCVVAIGTNVTAEGALSLHKSLPCAAIVYAERHGTAADVPCDEPPDLLNVPLFY